MLTHINHNLNTYTHKSASWSYFIFEIASSFGDMR